MKYIIDRIEDNRIAVCTDENGAAVLIEVCLLPDGVRGGSVIFGNENDGFYLDEAAEKRLRHENFLLAQELFDE